MTRPLFLAAILPLLFTPALLADSIVAGTPQNLTPLTYARGHEGTNLTLAANARGYLALWQSGDNRVMGTRFDRNGVRIDSEGFPLTGLSPTYGLGLASSGSGFDLITFSYGSSQSGIYGSHVDENGNASPLSLITPIEYARNFRLTFNGSDYLATWMTQEMYTETLYGVLLDRDLHVVKPAFTITTREVPVQYYGRALTVDVATDGTGFLVAWELAAQPTSPLVLVGVTASGDVLPPTATSYETPVLQPSVTATPAGYAVAWHDGQTIRAAYANSNGVITGSPSVVVAANAKVNELAFRSNDRATAIAYAVEGQPFCNDITVSSSIYLQNVSASLTPVGPPHRLAQGDVNKWIALAGTANSFVTTWENQMCNAEGRVQAVPEVDLQPAGADSVSDFLTVAPQSTPAMASDGASAVVVWSEQRTDDAAPQIYAVRVGDGGAGNAISAGASPHKNPRIAFDGQRYLATWWQADDGGTIAGRFLSADGSASGEAFTIGYGSQASLDVVWTGSEYVVAWTSGGEVRAARIAANGEALSVSVAGNYTTTGAIHLAAGPGEAVAAFEATTSSSYLVDAAVIRGNISITGTITAAKLGQCLSKDCEFGAKPLGIAWSGHDYLVTSSIIHHPAYGYDVYATPLAIGGVPLTTAVTHIRNSWQATFPMAGSLAWTGRDYFFVMPIDQSARGSFWLVRLDPAGAIESASAVEAHGEVIPSLAAIGPMRYLLTYADGRVVTRTIDLAPAGPRRRVAPR